MQPIEGPESTASSNPAADFVLAPFRLRTYANLVYLWLSFPLGLFTFIVMLTGFLMGVGLLIVWIGVLVLLATLLFCWVLGGFERFLAEGLLGARIPRASLPAVGELGILGWLGAVLRSPVLYKSLLFLGLRFPLGLAGWVFSVVGLSVSGSFIVAPIAATLFGVENVNVDLWFWRAESVADTLPLMLVGIALLWVTVNVQNVLASLWRAMAEALLGGDDAVVVPPAAAPQQGLTQAAA